MGAGLGATGKVTGAAVVGFEKWELELEEQWEPLEQELVGLWEEEVQDQEMLFRSSVPLNSGQKLLRTDGQAGPYFLPVFGDVSRDTIQ